MGKDYRNMVLLWDLIGLMATSENLDIFAERFIEAIQGAFRTRASSSVFKMKIVRIFVRMQVAFSKMENATLTWLPVMLTYRDNSQILSLTS